MDALPDNVLENVKRTFLISVDAIINFEDKTGRMQRTRLLATGRTINEQALWLQTSSVEGAPVAAGPKLQSGLLEITPQFIPDTPTRIKPVPPDR